MEERREVREQTMDGREERGEGYRRRMEEGRKVRDTDEGWKRGGKWGGTPEGWKRGEEVGGDTDTRDDTRGEGRGGGDEIKPLLIIQSTIKLFDSL
jgi:hypothetical protein